MIEKSLKTMNGKLRVKMPTELNEITLGQMIELQENPNLTDLGAISILSGIPVSELQNITDINDISIFGDVVLSLSYQIKHLYEADFIPKKITFNIENKSITVKVINNLSVEPAGAFMSARDIIADEINEHINKHGNDDWEDSFNPSLNACCQVLANYFFCRVTGRKYNEYEVDEFTNEIKKLWVTEALPLAKHFFICYPSLSIRKISFFRRLHQSWRKRLA